LGPIAEGTANAKGQKLIKTAAQRVPVVVPSRTKWSPRRLRWNHRGEEKLIAPREKKEHKKTI